MDEEMAGVGSRVQHSRYGQGVVVGIRLTGYLITFMEAGMHEINMDDAHLEVLSRENVSPELETMSDYEKSLLGILRKWADVQEIVPLGDRWTGGTMVLKPKEEQQQAKVIPVETFFHKIVMVRDRLRVLEQAINSQTKLSDEDKVNLQQYITRCYGSLTTFNVLFKLKEQQFVGEKSKD